MDKKIIAYRNKKWQVVKSLKDDIFWYFAYSGRNKQAEKALLRGVSLYYYNGEYCFINYLIEDKEPLVSNGLFGVYKIKDFSGESISCYNHIYWEAKGNGEEIVYTSVVNIENQHKLVEEFVTIDYAMDDEYEREFKIMTDKYYSWKSLKSDMFDSYKETGDFEFDDSLYPVSDIERVTKEELLIEFMENI